MTAKLLPAIEGLHWNIMEQQSFIRNHQAIPAHKPEQRPWKYSWAELLVLILLPMDSIKALTEFQNKRIGPPLQLHAQHLFCTTWQDRTPIRLLYSIWQSDRSCTNLNAFQCRKVGVRPFYILIFSFLRPLHVLEFNDDNGIVIGKYHVIK